MVDMTVLDTMQALYPQLSPSKQELCKYLLDNWQEAAFWPAGVLARKVGVSESLVVRFAQDLGYSGYKKVQHELHDLVRARLPMAGKLAVSPVTKSTDEEIVSGSIQNDVDNLNGILEMTPATTFIAVADAIVKARRVYVVGMANSSASAQLLAGMLNLLTGEAFALAHSAWEVFDRLTWAAPEDLVIGISFAHYMKTTLQAAELAKQRKATLVAITDGPLAPLARVADYSILVRNRGISFAESQASTVAVINILINLVARRAGERQRTGLAQIDDVYQHFGLFV
jgi:DNA-binding MurR/RpiR family transcriptional regulator